MSLDPTDIGIDGRLLLRSSSLAEDQAIIEVLNVAPAEFFHRHGTVIFEALLRRIVASRNTPQLSLRFSAGQFRCPHAVRSQSKASCAPSLAILDDVASLP